MTLRHSAFSLSGHSRAATSSVFHARVKVSGPRIPGLRPGWMDQWFCDTPATLHRSVGFGTKDQGDPLHECLDRLTGMSVHDALAALRRTGRERAAAVGDMWVVVGEVDAAGTAVAAGCMLNRAQPDNAKFFVCSSPADVTVTATADGKAVAVRAHSAGVHLVHNTGVMAHIQDRTLTLTVTATDIVW